MNIDVEDLGTLLAVHESSHLSEAAARLSISQPALTVRLQKIQERQAFPLLLSVGRRKVVNPALGPILERLKGYRFELEQEFKTLVEDKVHPQELKLQVGGRPTLVERLLEEIRFPGRVEASVCDSREAVKKLLRGDLNFALTHVVEDSLELVYKKWFQNSWKLVWSSAVAKKSFRNTSEALEGLKDASWAIHDSANLGFLEKLLGASPKLGLQVDDWRVIFRAVAQHGLCALVPSGLIREAEGVKGLDLGERGSREIFYIAYRRDYRRSPILKFIEPAWKNPK